MGIFRFILAVSVVLEHLGGSFQLIGGFRAVQVFYYISGFYMALILNGKYQNSHYGTFLGNRFLRLFPIYYVSLVFLGLRFLSSYINQVPCEYYIPHCGQIVWQHLWSLCFIIFTQLAIVGQDWLFFLKLDSSGVVYFSKNGLSEVFQAYAYNINPVSWTLGLEISFYLMAPFLMKRSHRTLLTLVFFSICFRILGYFKLGLTDLVWTYRFFPFELATFLLGSLCYRFYQSYLFAVFGKTIWGPSVLAVIVMLATLLFVGLTKVVSYPTVIYYCIAGVSVPALFYLTRKNSLDRMIGDLSFPIYLIHMPICSLAKRFLTTNSVYIIVLLIISALVLNKVISQPIDRFRERRLKKDS